MTMGTSPFSRRDFQSLVGLDWDDASAVDSRTRPLAARFAAEKKRLVDGIAHAMDSPDLSKRCETNYFNHRIVLYHDHEEGFSLRLHFLEPQKAEGPHDHRATFSAMILRGSYQHQFYHVPDRALSASYSSTEPDISSDELQAIVPFLVRRETAGSFYTLHTSAFHATQSDAEHISLVLRGPSTKDRLLYIDEQRSSAAWQYGGAFEAPDAVEKKRMSADTLGELIQRVEKI
jgi:hypothetical protein